MFLSCWSCSSPARVAIHVPQPVFNRQLGQWSERVQSVSSVGFLDNGIVSPPLKTYKLETWHCLPASFSPELFLPRFFELYRNDNKMRRTCYSHQASILSPVIARVWNRHQEMYMSGRQQTDGSHWLFVEMDEQILMRIVPSLAPTTPLILKKEYVQESTFSQFRYCIIEVNEHFSHVLVLIYETI